MIRSRNLADSNLYLKFKKLAFQLNLAFSDCDLLGDILFGLDLKKRKLVIAEAIGNVNWRYTIALADLKTIAVKKVYRSIRAGELSFRKMNDFVNSIHVRLDFRNGQESIVLPIYGYKGIDSKNIQKIERKLGRWYNMLSRMISREINLAVKSAW